MPKAPALFLRNTFERKKEKLPFSKKPIGLYTCGPTVYSFAHIGNLRTYLFEDVLERTIRGLGQKIKRVMNITDVGHLTGDADAGDDKVERAAQAQGKTPAEITAFYTDAFLKDLERLNIRIPKLLIPATKTIPEQIALIRQLMKKGYAYEAPEAVYFDTTRFPRYEELMGQSRKDRKTGARDEVITETEKKHPSDFALWFKAVGRFAHHLQRWPSPWGEGFPGWHIECSAISRKYLGQPFAIHTGGIDHTGTHHPNEIAQSEAAYGKPLARFWLHSEFLLVDGEKMAKSVGNVYTLADLEKKEMDPLAFRLFTLGAHYRTRLNFTWDALRSSALRLSTLKEKYQAIAHEAKKEKKKKTIPKEARLLSEAFWEAMTDDLNTPKALAVLSKTLKAPITASEKKTLIDSFDTVLGLDLKAETKTIAIPRAILLLAAKREAARLAKNFAEADMLRDELEQKGYTVKDTPTGPLVEKHHE
jgi:cysteinyl-tRNA synthetase